MHMQRLQQMRHPRMRPKRWFEPGEADKNSSEVLDCRPDTVPVHARDFRSSRAHTQQRVCARVPPFRALVPLAGALLDMSLPLYYRVAAFEQFTNGTREPSRARARRQAHARRPA